MENENKIMDEYINKIISRLKFNISQKNLVKVYDTVQEVINKKSARLCREVLINCDKLPNNLKKDIFAVLRSTVGTKEGDAENFFYEYQINNDYIMKVWPGGAVAIKIFIEEAFEKEGINIPDDIKRQLDEIINVEIESDIVTNLVVLRQHVFKDDKSENPPLKFDNYLLYRYKTKDQ